ncbi:MAG: POTRA domain-containing protein [Terracidiphilus sp.]|jgi:outer membrane protein assembly factor BamA
MKRTPFVLLAAFLVLTVSLPLAAQKFLPKTIQFKGDPEYSDQELLAAAGLKKGVVLTSAEMNEHSKRLMDTGVFDTLTFKFDGVDLVFILVPSTTLYPIRLENLPLTPGKDLDAVLHDRFPLYHGKVPAEGGLLDEVRGALEEMLAAQGIKASVSATPAGSLGSRKLSAMSFAIASPVRVGAIQLQGVSAAMQAKVKAVADRTVGTSFDTANSERNVEHAFESFYADEGYAAVKVHAVQAASPVATADAIDVPFTVTVEEGRLYKLGAIHLPPDSLVSQADLDKVAGVRADGPARGLILRSTWSMIASRYKSKGYLDCAVTPHPEFDEATGAVNYTVDINPGPIYHLAFVKFENVSDEMRSRLMRVWQMLPGDPFDESYVSSFVFRAQKEDPVLLRSLAGVKVSYESRADQQTHEVNCVIHFTRTLQTP